MSHFERDRKVWEVRRDFPVVIANELRLRQASATFDWQSKLVTVNECLIIRAVVSRCRTLGDSHGWLLRLNSLGKPDITIIGRLAPGNREFQDYFLLKPQNMRGLTQATLRPGKDSIFDKYRYDDFSFLKNVTRLSKAKRAGRL